MPLLYGEEENAFIRLQEEIIKERNDLSIFTWGPLDTNLGPQDFPLFASSPKDFTEAGDIESYGGSPEFVVTNKGLKIEVALGRLPLQFNEYFMPTTCKKGRTSVGLLLFQTYNGSIRIRVTRAPWRGGQLEH